MQAIHYSEILEVVEDIQANDSVSVAANNLLHLYRFVTVYVSITKHWKPGSLTQSCDSWKTVYILFVCFIGSL